MSVLAENTRVVITDRRWATGLESQPTGRIVNNSVEGDYWVQLDVGTWGPLSRTDDKKTPYPARSTVAIAREHVKVAAHAV